MTLALIGFTGSRRWTDVQLLENTLLGVRDRLADWDGPCGPECPPGHRRRNRRGTEYCPLAGHRRNQQMVDEGPLLFVAAQVQGSTGTADCMRRAKAAGIPVHLITA